MIRKASLYDLDEIYNIECSAFASPWEKVSIEAEFYKDYASIYVYEKSRKIVAYIITWLLGDEAELITLAVDENFRIQGIGKELFSYIKEIYGKNIIWHLEVACDNNIAIDMYKGFGFEITSTISNYYGNEKNAYRMILVQNKIDRSLKND